MKCKDGTVSKSILYSNFNYKACPLNVHSVVTDLALKYIRVRE